MNASDGPLNPQPFEFYMKCHECGEMQPFGIQPKLDVENWEKGTRLKAYYLMKCRKCPNQVKLDTHPFDRNDEAEPKPKKKVKK